MRSKKEIQKDTESFIEIFNSSEEILTLLLIQQDPSDQEPLGFLSEMINTVKNHLTNIDKNTTEELKKLDEELFSPLIRDIQSEILWRMENQVKISNHPDAANLQKKLEILKTPLSINEFSSLVKEFNKLLPLDLKVLRDVKLIIDDGQKCIDLFSELPNDLSYSVSDTLKEIDKQIEKLKELKDITKLKDAHTQLSLLIRTVQTEMLRYFLKQAEESKAPRYLEKLKKYEVMFSEKPRIRLSPETMTSLIDGFKEIALYAMPKKTAKMNAAPSATVSDAHNSPAPTSKGKKTKKGRTKRVVAIADPAQPESLISEKSIARKSRFMPYQEQVAEIDKSIRAVNQTLLELGTQSNIKGEPLKSQPHNIKKTLEMIDKLNQERAPYKLFLTSCLSDFSRKPEEEERNNTKESIFSQFGNKLKSVLPVQPEVLSNPSKLLDGAKSENDVKREFEALDRGTTLRALIAKEKEYLESLTQLANEIKYQDIFSPDKAVQAKYKEKYRAVCEKNAIQVKAAESYNALFERKISLTKAQEEKLKELNKQEVALTRAEEKYKLLSTQKADVEEEHQALRKLQDSFAKAKEEYKALGKEIDTVTEDEHESRAFYERQVLTRDEQDFKTLYEQKTALVQAKDEYNALCMEFDEIYKHCKEPPSAPMGTELTKLTSTLSNIKAEQDEAVNNVVRIIKEINDAKILQIAAIKGQTSILQHEISLLKSRHLMLSATVVKYNDTVDAVKKERVQFNKDCKDALQSVKDLFAKLEAQAKVYNLSDNYLAEIRLQIHKAESGMRLVLNQYNSCPHSVWNTKKQDQLDRLAMIQSSLETKIKAGNEDFLESTREIKRNVESLRDHITQNASLLRTVYTPEELAEVNNKLDLIMLALKNVTKPQLKDLSKPISLNAEPLALLKRRVSEQQVAIDRAIENAKALKKAAAAKSRATAQAEAPKPEPTFLESLAQVASGFTKNPKKENSRQQAQNKKPQAPIHRPVRTLHPANIRSESAELIQASANQLFEKETEKPKSQGSSPTAPTKNTQSLFGNEPQVADDSNSIKDTKEPPRILEEKIPPHSVAQTMEESTNSDTTGVANKEKQEPQNIQVPSTETPLDSSTSLLSKASSDNPTPDPDEEIHHSDEVPQATITNTDIKEDNNTSTDKSNSKEVQIIKTMRAKIQAEIDRIRTTHKKEDETEDPRINILNNMDIRLNQNLGCYLLPISTTTPADFINSSILSISEALREGDSNYHSLTTEVSNSFINFINTLLRPLTWGFKTWNGENYRARFFPNETEVMIASAAEEAHKGLIKLQQELTILDEPDHGTLNAGDNPSV